MDSVQRSFRLFVASLKVLSARRELLLFPLVSVAAVIGVILTFLIPILALSASELNDGKGLTGTSWLLLLLLYFALSYVIIFCNAALVHAADEALRGENPSVKGSFAAASESWRSLLRWSILAGTLSLLLRALEDRLGVAGKVAMALAGIAWALVTFLVLPLIVLEGAGVRQALRRAAGLFTETWGEQVAGRIGIGLAGLVLGVLGLPLFMIGAAADSGVVFALCLVVAVLWWLAVAALSGALSGVYQTVLYRYAAWKRVAPGFEKVDLPQVFPAK